MHVSNLWGGREGHTSTQIYSATLHNDFGRRHAHKSQFRQGTSCSHAFAKVCTFTSPPMPNTYIYIYIYIYICIYLFMMEGERN